MKRSKRIGTISTLLEVAVLSGMVFADITNDMPYSAADPHLIVTRPARPLVTHAASIPILQHTTPLHPADAIESKVLSTRSHPTLLPVNVTPKMSGKFYARRDTPIETLIDDKDRPLTAQERSYVQKALDQLPTDSLIGLTSIYIARDQKTRGLLSPLNGKDIVLSLEDSDENAERPLAIRNAILQAVSQYVYAYRLKPQELQEWKELHPGQPWTDQALKDDFSTQYTAYALDSWQDFRTAIVDTSDPTGPAHALERLLFIVSLFTEKGSPLTELRYYKTYDTGVTDTPWPPQTARRDSFHVQMGPFYFQLKGQQLLGWKYVSGSLAANWTSSKGYYIPDSYTRIMKPVTLPKTLQGRIPTNKTS